MRLIDADDFANRMYHEAFEKDTDMQKWDSGCWIRYKLFENVLREQPTVHPNHIADIGKKVSISCDHEKDHTADSSKMVCVDAISRQETIHAISDWIYDTTDERLPEQVIRSLPAAQPEPHWIPCGERLPENDNEVLITVWDAEDDYVEVYKGFYQEHEWWTQWCHGCSKIKDEPCGENIVIAWMPLPEPYRGGEK